MRVLLLAIFFVSVPFTAIGEELGDIDMQMIVELADGVWKGDVISVQEITHRSKVDGQRSPYRNVWVLIRMPDGSPRSFRASKIEGGWRLDEEEIKRLDHLRKLDPKNVNWSNIR